MTSRTQALVGAVLVGLLGLGALISTAFHANTTTTQLVSNPQLVEADYSDAYYSCLEAQGHRLLRPSDRVYMSQPDLDRLVTLTKALGGWAHLQEHRAGATVAILLVDEPRHARIPTCRGPFTNQTLVSIRTTRSGHVVMAHASVGGGGGVGAP